MFTNVTSWDEPVSQSRSVDLSRDFALMHARQGGVLGKVIASFIKKGDLSALCAYSMDYTVEGMTPTQYYHTRQALAFFTKVDDLEIGIDKQAAAIKKFMESESLCRETNEVFRAWQDGRFSFLPSVDRVLSDAAQLIAKVLGPVPAISKLGLRFGPGATTLTKKRDASARRKLRDGLACSDNLLPILADVLEEVAPWVYDLNEDAYQISCDYHGTPWYVGGDVSLLDPRFQATMHVEPHIREVSIHTRASLQIQLMDEELSFALKNASILRPVSKPPPLTGMVQLGIGDYMAKRLARFGIDLKDQSLNQALAKEGSLTGELATLDLSSASDTIAIELLHHLLPVDWFILLNQARCSHVTYEGDRLRMEKFASMGNGYTFPLECLVFWALAKVSCDTGDVVSVYGDDIILPSRHAVAFKSVLDACGFVLNTSKSYSTGPFRESCGADWFRGFNIRPWYSKTTFSLATLYQLRNYYVRSLQFEAADLAEMLIPDSFKKFGPDGYGDGVLIGKFTPVKKAAHVANGYSGVCFSAYRMRAVKEVLPPLAVDAVHASYSIYRRISLPAVQSSLHIPSGNVAFAQKLLHKRFLESKCIVGEPIPCHKGGDFPGSKAASLPGVDGSESVLIYTLDLALAA